MFLFDCFAFNAKQSNRTIIHYSTRLSVQHCFNTKAVLLSIVSYPNGGHLARDMYPAEAELYVHRLATAVILSRCAEEKIQPSLEAFYLVSVCMNRARNEEYCFYRFRNFVGLHRKEGVP